MALSIFSKVLCCEHERNKQAHAILRLPSEIIPCSSSSCCCCCRSGCGRSCISWSVRSKLIIVLTSIFSLWNLQAQIPIRRIKVSQKIVDILGISFPRAVNTFIIIIKLAKVSYGNPVTFIDRVRLNHQT